MTETTIPTTCTIFTAAGRCGAPAATTFTGRDGTVYAECAEHAPAFAAAETPVEGALVVGARVKVLHIGIEKIATVTRVGTKWVSIRLPIHGGKAEKVIDRRIADVTVV